MAPVMRPTWRTNPFSEGGRVIAGTHYAGGTLLPQPNPLYNVSLDAPDIAGLPWDRRTYDAWTTEPFRAAVKTWLIAFLAADTWIGAWHVREKLTGFLTLIQTQPQLIVTVTRRVDGMVFQTSTAWTLEEREDLALAQPKLDAMKLAIDDLEAASPPP